MAEDLRIRITGDDKGFQSALNSARGNATGFSRSIGKASKFAALGLAGLATGAAAAGAKMVSMASDAAEVDSKLNVVFGKRLPALKKDLDAFSEATGTSRYALRQQAADMGALLGPILKSKAATQDMSSQFVKLATDLGSFNNVPTGEALESIRAGLLGEAEPMRKFGVLMNEAAVQSEALRLGLIKKGQTMTEQEKVQARASLIMQQTSQAQGDATRTAGSMANQMKALRANVGDAATEIGMKLMPYALQAVQSFNANWPTIERVAGRVMGYIITVIEASIVVIRKLIDWYSGIADAARRYWPQVQQAAERVANWYRGTLAPAIENTLAAIRRAWEIFGPTISRIASTAFGVVRTVVVNTLSSIKAVIEGFLALIRGDWGQAWESLKTIVRNALDTVKTIVQGAISVVWTAALGVGNAIVQGIKQGIEGAWGELTGYVGAKMDALKNKIKGFWKIFSPSQVAADEIGKPIAEGIGVGFLSQMDVTIPQMAAASGRASDEARRNVEAKTAAWKDAWKTYTDKALEAFDAMADKIRTKSERLLDQLNARTYKLDLKQAAKDVAAAEETLKQAKLQARGANATGDQEAMKEANDALFEAQMAADRAEIAQQQLKLEKKAEKERQAEDEKIAADRERFATWLETRTVQQQQAILKEGQGQEAIVRKIRSYGPEYRKAGVNLGENLANGLESAASKVKKAAQALADAVSSILNAAGKPGRDASDAAKKVTGKASGGRISGGRPYLVGENGPELRTFSRGGSIIPNNLLMGGGGSRSMLSGGGSTVTAPIVIVLDGGVIWEEMREVGIQESRYVPSSSVTPDAIRGALS